jgi:hypothetical protein
MSVFSLEYDPFSGVYTLLYFGKEVGYISKIKYEHDGRKGFRAVSVHGHIQYARTLTSAQDILMGAYH